MDNSYRDLELMSSSESQKTFTDISHDDHDWMLLREGR